MPIIPVLPSSPCLPPHRDSPEHTRHLLRLWVSPPDDRPLPEVYSEIMGGSVVPGKRGGIFIQNADHNPIPLEAE